jgi:hypothetical protein
MKAVANGAIGEYGRRTCSVGADATSKEPEPGGVVGGESALAGG